MICVYMLHMFILECLDKDTPQRLGLTIEGLLDFDYNECWEVSRTIDNIFRVVPKV